MNGIDLHAHTTASDGSESPSDVVRQAKELGLLAIAITDHDTVGGLPEAATAAQELGIDFVPGVELSVEDDSGRFHMLGYLFEQEEPTLVETLVGIRKSRAERNELILQKANSVGFKLTWEDLYEQAGEEAEVIGRPHIAAALLKKGYVSTRQEAFDKYLATDQLLYFPKQVLSPTEAVKLIHDAGGVTIMAHPGLSKWADPAKLEPRVRQLKEEAGLDGIEPYYSQHSKEQTTQYLAIAGRLNMLISGGSDFHGDPKPHVKLGVVYDGQPASPSLLPPLREAAAQCRKA